MTRYDRQILLTAQQQNLTLFLQKVLITFPDLTQSYLAITLKSQVTVLQSHMRCVAWPRKESLIVVCTDLDTLVVVFYFHVTRRAVAVQNDSACTRRYITAITTSNTSETVEPQQRTYLRSFVSLSSFSPRSGNSSSASV